MNVPDILRDILDCIAVTLVIPLLCASAAAYHIFPKYAERFAERVSGHGRVSARVMSASEDGGLVIRFRIEREKKTVIQKCRLFKPPGKAFPKKYFRGDRITVYYRDDGMRAEAIPENENRWAYMYEFLRRLCVQCFAAAVICAVLAVIL